jgi:hypothetical protein
MSSEPILEELTCPWCDARVRHGVFVCRGCHADIAYGITWREIKGAFLFGIVVGGIADVLVFWKLNVPVRWTGNVLVGLPVGAAVVFAILSWLGARGKPRFFRRRAL